MSTAFLITPFTSASAGDEDEEVFNEVQQAIVEAARLAKVDLKLASDIFQGGIVVQQIRQAIEEADVVVAVCTGRNANVFYELGLAEVLGHKPILVAATKDDLPFDMAHWRCHMYAAPDHDIGTLVDRLRRAMEETIRARFDDPQPDLAAAPSTSTAPATETEASVQSGPTVGIDLDLPLAVQTVRQGDFVGFSENLKRLTQIIADYHGATAIENENIQPSIVTLDGMREIRYQGVSDLLDWIKPAIEYQPEWMDKVVDVVVPWFDRSATGTFAGFSFWVNLHKIWVTLFLKSAVAYGLKTSAWSSVRTLFSAGHAGTDPREPLLVSPDFIWAGGDSGVLFRDFLNFISLDGRFGPNDPPENRTAEGARVACGADMAMGLARCLYEASIGEPTDGRNLGAYAAFASYFCPNIQWLARALDRNDAAAQALGAQDAGHLRQVATKRWGELIALHHPQSFVNTCSTWADATGRTTQQ